MILEIIFSCVIGTVLHFTYEASRHNNVVSIFSPVNESVWEHVKMALTPLIFFSIINLIIYGVNSITLFSVFTTLITVIILIPILFYSYFIFTKKELVITDILIFYLSIILAYLFGNMVLNLNGSILLLIIDIIGLLLILFSYFSFTKFPPKIFLFKDSITGKYGIDAHICHEHKK